VIDTEGKRVKSFAKDGRLIGTKVYMFKVSPKGKITILNKIDPDTIRGRRRGRPAPQSLRFFNAKTLSKFPNLYREYREMLTKDLQRRAVMAKREELEGITMALDGDLTPFYNRAAGIIERIAMSEKVPLAFYVEGSMFVLKGIDDDEGMVIDFQSPFITTQEFTKIIPRGKNKITHDPTSLIRARIHTAIAQALQDYGLVSISSARRIRKLAMNKGKPRDEWEVKTSQGKKFKWEGRGMEDALVQEITFRIVPAGRGKK
jgi:hypothetical protein